MQRKLKSILISTALTLAFSAPSMAAATPKKMINIEHWKTRNGSDVYFVRNEYPPELTIRVLFNAGSINDDKAFGLASFTNLTLLDNDAGDMSSQQISDAAGDNGCVLDSDASEEQASMSLRTLTQQPYMNKCLNLFKTVLGKPTFDNAAVNRIRQKLFALQKSQLQDPSDRSDLAFMKTLYGPDSPLGHSTVGTHTTVAKITRQQLIDFYKKYYATNNATILMVGNLTDSQAQPIAQQVISALTSGDKTKSPKIIIPKLSKKLKRIQMHTNQSYVRIGTLIPYPDATTRFPLLVGNYILGGGVLISRLNDVLREKNGLTYSVRSQFLSLKPLQPWQITFQTKNADTDKAIGLTMNTLKNYVNHGPTAAEMVQAKLFLKNSLPLSLSSNSNVLSMLEVLSFNNLPIDFFDNYGKNVNAVTQEQIMNLFQQYFTPDKISTVVVEGKK